LESVDSKGQRYPVSVLDATLVDGLACVDSKRVGRMRNSGMDCLFLFAAMNHSFFGEGYFQENGPKKKKRERAPAAQAQISMAS
jgi:hypothetical protein